MSHEQAFETLHHMERRKGRHIAREAGFHATRQRRPSLLPGVGALPREHTEQGDGRRLNHTLQILKRVIHRTVLIHHPTRCVGGAPQIFLQPFAYDGSADVEDEVGQRKVGGCSQGYQRIDGRARCVARQRFAQHHDALCLQTRNDGVPCRCKCLLPHHHHGAQGVAECRLQRRAIKRGIGLQKRRVQRDGACGW